MILRFGCFRIFQRQRTNLRAANLKSALVRSLIREALASRTLNGKRRTFAIAIAEPNAVIVAEVIFCEVAVQMLLATMLIHAAHASLEDRKVAFG